MDPKIKEVVEMVARGSVGSDELARDIALAVAIKHPRIMIELLIERELMLKEEEAAK